jgi:transcriptional regulator with XRE-family HTH domain
MEIGKRVRLERLARGWTLDELSSRSGVSRAMLSKIERDDASPTAELLIRIAAAFSLTLSALIARAEGAAGALLRASEQPEWRDPATGYIRRALSPAGNSPLELVHVVLPPMKEVRFPERSYTFISQQIWMLAGVLEFHEGEILHRLEAGDCLLLGQPADCRFFAPGPDPATYLVALVRT